MTVSDISRKLPTTITLTTLGGESSFDVINRNGVVMIINSGRSALTLTDALVDAVHSRFLSLPLDQRFMAGKYVDPEWPDVPNRIFSPYIARVIMYIL